MSAGLQRCATSGRSMSLAGAKAFGGITYMISCWEAGKPPSIVTENARKRRQKYALQRQKTFSEFTYMNKEEHDRERQRWSSRMEEIESRLAESETLNSDMSQIKAELNKKIVELERSQRPLIEQNRKLSDRNKNLMQELKRLENKIAHQMDDYITLKDSHERVVKENGILKRERTLPEKLEELDRYRNQVLEYSKCITALRQAGLEKDRRYEILVMKMKRLRRVARAGEEDRHSTVGSDCSAESTISLDTITEDLEETVSKELQSSYEALYRENEELTRALAAMGGDEASLREQLALARATIAHQQNLIDCNSHIADVSHHYKATISKQADRLVNMEEEVERLQRELATTEEQRELLEFQVLEIRECGSSYSNNERDSSPPQAEEEEEYEVKEIEYAPRKLSFNEVVELKEEIRGLKRAGNLAAAQRRSAGRCYAYLESLENQWIEHEAVCGKGTDLNGNSAHLLSEVRELSGELGRVRFQLAAKEQELATELSKVELLERRLDDLHRGTDLAELEAAMRQQMDEISALQSTLNANRDKLKASDAERIKLQGDLNVVRAECQRLRDDQRPAVKTDLERRFEETRFRLAEAVKKIDGYEKIIDAARRLDGGSSASYADALERELEECKQYNEHIERQFKTQTEIIDTLKTRVISSKTAMDFLGTLPSLGSATMRCAIIDYTRSAKDEGARKTVSLVADIVEHAIREESICDNLKLRECRSTDSGGDSISNGSEAASATHSEDEDWARHRTQGTNGNFAVMMQR